MRVEEGSVSHSEVTAQASLNGGLDADDAEKRLESQVARDILLLGGSAEGIEVAVFLVRAPVTIPFKALWALGRAGRSFWWMVGGRGRGSFSKPA